MLQVVSDDGKRVKRQQPFTESDLQELKVLMDFSALYILFYKFEIGIDSLVSSPVVPNCCCRKSSW